MLGLILLYWIGKSFYKLAETYDKNKWGFAILGIISFYAGSFISQFLIGVAIVLISGEEAIDNITDLQSGLIGLPFGLLTLWILHRVLKKSWSRQGLASTNVEVLDDLENF